MRDNPTLGVLLVAAALSLVLTMPWAAVAPTLRQPPGRVTGPSAQDLPASPNASAQQPLLAPAAGEIAVGPWAPAPGNISLLDSNYSVYTMVYDAASGQLYSFGYEMPRSSLIAPLVGRYASWVPGSLNATVIPAPYPMSGGTLVVDPQTGDVFLGSPANSTGPIPLFVLNATDGNLSIPVEVNSPWTGSNWLNPVAYDDASGVMYMADQLDNGSTAIFAISASTFATVATFVVPGSLFGGAYDNGNGDLYLSTGFPDLPFPLGTQSPGPIYQNLTVVSTATNAVVSTLQNVSEGTVLFDPQNLNVYVVSQNVTVLNTTSGVLSTVVTEGGTGTGLLDPQEHALYVANGTQLLDISTRSNQVVGFLAAPALPQTFALDSQTGILYSCDVSSAPPNFQVNYSVDPVNPATTRYTVGFTESGLAPGTSWSVSVNGQLLRSNGTQITVYEPDGNYTFLLPEVPGWTPTVSAGTFAVSDGAEYLNITYRSTPDALVGSVRPATATVYLGSQRLNLTAQGNFSVRNLTAGVYSIRVTAPGYYPYATNVSITYGNTTRVTIRLVSEAPPPVPWTTLTPLAGLLIGGVTAAAVVAVGAVTVYFRRRIPPA